MRPLIDVIGLPSPELARRLVTLLGLAEASTPESSIGDPHAA
ncbi:hypothetical protein [Planomonospora parontospora]|nr:hypothetical protein [Planomonospora parontospora]